MSIFLSFIDIDITFKIAAIMDIICCVYIFSNRNTFFPFLGPSYIPEISTEYSDHHTTIDLEIPAPDNTKIFYWNTEMKDPNPIEMKETVLTTGVAYIKNNKTNIHHLNNEKFINFRLLYPASKFLTGVCTKPIN
jgi:hypothetical protein